MPFAAKLFTACYFSAFLSLPGTSLSASPMESRGGDESQSPTEPLPLPPSYELIAPIVEVNCTPCHNSGFASGDVLLESKEDLLAQRVLVENAVQSGFMPYGQPEWKDSDDGKLLLAWLAAQPPAPPPLAASPIP